MNVNTRTPSILKDVVDWGRSFRINDPKEVMENERDTQSPENERIIFFVVLDQIFNFDRLTNGLNAYVRMKLIAHDIVHKKYNCNRIVAKTSFSEYSQLYMFVFAIAVVLLK